VKRARLVESVLRVEGTGQSWERLSRGEQEEVLPRLDRCLREAIGEAADELQSLGQVPVKVSRGTVEVRNFVSRLSDDQLVKLIELLGTAASRAETRCIAEIEGGGEATGGVQGGFTQEGGSGDEDGTGGVAVAPWACSTCDAMNPGGRSVCQICGTENVRSASAASDSVRMS
jgi:hypothetical protein